MVEIKKAQGKELIIEEHIFIGNITEIITSTKQSRQKEKIAELRNNQVTNTKMIINLVENLERKRDSEDSSEVLITRKKKKVLELD